MKIKTRSSGIIAAVTVIASLSATLLVLNSCGKPAGLDDDEAGTESPVPYPGIHGQEFSGEKNFARLINSNLESKASPQPWAGFWWPYASNGIASGTYGGSSPAGKYDAARGGQTNAQMWEVKNHGSKVPKLQGWWGHCNGWTAAAGLFAEPRESARVNGITFEVADIKALLTEAAMEVNADFFGERVDWGHDYSLPKFGDTVADQFFLVLTNYMGRLKKAVLMDRYTGDQVWNHPIVAYRFEYPKPADYLGASPTAPGVFRILLTGSIWWARDDVTPGTLTAPFNHEVTDHFDSRELKMEIWVDAPVTFDANGKVQSSGDVIVSREGDYFAGGAWRMGEGYYNDAWPDYMWVPYSVTKPTDYANVDVDIEWIRKHLLVPGGLDDPTASPRPVNPAPSPQPTPSTFPSGWPTNWPLPPSNPDPEPTNPWPRPTRTVTPIPVPTGTTIPAPRPRPDPDDPLPPPRR
ncbi:MAG: hypothetical protein A2X94_11025 [Bdellovibrionales bacterium GWB1_55_8]|nr:MAG: hypothetical protein A2X94_11025 [Bdellovibrionales bacterium GWB1_55_8]